MKKTTKIKVLIKKTKCQNFKEPRSRLDQSWMFLVLLQCLKGTEAARPILFQNAQTELLQQAFSVPELYHL